MTLREFITKQQIAYVGDAIRYFKGSDKEYYKRIGKANMCTDLIDMLSDETLTMEVETRAEALTKAKKKNAPCCQCGCPFMKGD